MSVTRFEWVADTHSVSKRRWRWLRNNWEMSAPSPDFENRLGKEVVLKSEAIGTGNCVVSMIESPCDAEIIRMRGYALAERLAHPVIWGNKARVRPFIS